MKLVVTGGGTGGHIYPALEVARRASLDGVTLEYFGSLRGQESAACEARGIAFHGFGSQPLYSLRSLRGLKSLVSLLRATQAVKARFRVSRPDVVFSTGGYSAAPVMAAARSLAIPYTIHEANSIPGRSNRMFARQAKAFSCTFESTLARIPQAIRTGQPIREELRAEVPNRNAEQPPLILVLGGSQGSLFLNELMPQAARLLSTDVTVIHAIGKGNFARDESAAADAPRYTKVPYLEAKDLVRAYQAATLIVARSGGSVAEFAMFGIPSVLIPLPSSADDHQKVNALEFQGFGGATMVEQGNASPESVALAVESWQADSARCEAAAIALWNWDRPDATNQIYALLCEAAGK